MIALFCCQILYKRGSSMVLANIWNKGVQIEVKNYRLLRVQSVVQSTYY